MTFLAVILRFTGFYLLLKISVTVVFVLFDLKFNSWATYITIILAVRMSCDAFFKKRGYFFSKREFLIIVSSFALINMVFVASSLYLMYTVTPIRLHRTSLLAITIEAGLLHTAVICLTVWLTGRRFEKQMMMDAYNKQVQVYSTPVLSEAHIIKDIIESHGIRCDLRTDNQARNGLWESSSVLTESSLWISDTSKRDEVKRLIDEYENSPAQDQASADDTPWVCPSCGEESEGSFTSCWNCGGFKEHIVRVHQG